MVLDTSVAQAMKVDEVEISRLRKKLAKIQGVPERGIETWYRLASRNLYTRRQILNTKSSILLTVNSIILSIALGTLYPKLQEDWHLAYALVPLVLTNLFSIVFAVLATRPQLQSGMFAPEDVDQKTAHLMTFDDYFNMPQADFESAVDQIMQDRGFLYGTIKRDLYRLGKDLSRRYKNIRIAYNVFLFGIIFSVLMFGVCHLLF
ncbi:MAG: hypothetical protein EP344_09550 [Bacteroidetes bacterium]|nr:MAG: hypothetical protein EP344_09550 [Bacteroidota bacterium]